MRRDWQHVFRQGLNTPQDGVTNIWGILASVLWEEGENSYFWLAPEE